MNKKKLTSIVLFLTIMLIATIVIFYDPSTEATGNNDNINNTSESEEFTYEDGLTEAQLKTQEDDLKHKSGWSYYDSNKDQYIELWLFDEHWEYALSVWDNGVETHILTGHYLLSGKDNKDISIWLDGKEIIGSFLSEDVLIWGDRKFEKTTNE